MIDGSARCVSIGVKLNNDEADGEYSTYATLSPSR